MAYRNQNQKFFSKKIISRPCNGKNLWYKVNSFPLRGLFERTALKTFDSVCHRESESILH